MDRLYILLKRSQQGDQNALLDILEQFEPKIKKSLFQTSINNRDDLYQELQLKVIKSILNFDLDSCPSFLDYITHIPLNPQ